MYILCANYSQGRKERHEMQKYETLDEAEKMANDVLADPFIFSFGLYDLAICDQKGIIIKRFDVPKLP